MTSPQVLVNSSSTTNGVNVTGGSTVTITLANNTGVYAWMVNCIGTDDLNTSEAINATLVINHAAMTATFTMPNPIDGYGAAVIFQSVVNNALDGNGNIQSSYATTFGTFVLTTLGHRVFAANQTTESNSVYGWLQDFNLMSKIEQVGPVGNAGPAGPQGPLAPLTIGGDLSGTITNQVVDFIQGVQITGTPKVGWALTATSSTTASWSFHSPIYYETGPAIACCSDGTNVWTITNADYGGVTGPGTIQKLSGTNGTVLETNSSSTLNSLAAITHAFGYIWVVGKDYPATFDAALYQINISDASIAAIYTSGMPVLGSLSSDNSHLWATDGSALYKISTSGAVLDTYFSGDGYGCGPICFDGLDIWVGDTEGHQLLKVDPSSGSLLGLYSIGSSGTVPWTPQGLCTDGTYIWSANGTGHTTVTKTAIVSGSLIATYTLTETEPLSICTDGFFIYAVGNALTRIDILTGAVAYYDSSNGYLTNCINGSTVWCFQSPATGSLIGVYNF